MNHQLQLFQIDDRYSRLYSFWSNLISMACSPRILLQSYLYQSRPSFNHNKYSWTITTGSRLQRAKTYPFSYLRYSSPDNNWLSFYRSTFLHVKKVRGYSPPLDSFLTHTVFRSLNLLTEFCPAGSGKIGNEVDNSATYTQLPDFAPRWSYIP